MRTIKREIASAVIVSKDNKILFGFQDSASKSAYPDCWHIPGGGVEEGETPIQAMQREVKEEVGIDVSNYTAELVDDTARKTSSKQLKGTKEMVYVDMHFNDFKIVISDKNADEIEISLSDGEFVKYMWCDIPKLKNIKLTPPSVDLFTRLGWL